MMRSLVRSSVVVAVLCIAAAAVAGSPPDERSPKPRPKFIGKATMNPDGTIVLDLFIPAQARFEYERGHEKYEETLRHLGGLEPGEEKGVPPWPDAIDDDRVELAVQEYAERRGWPVSSYRSWISGTDRDGNVSVHVTHFTDEDPRAASVHLLLDPETYEVVKEADVK